MFICSEKKCTGCGICSLKCPKKCITLEENKEGFLYPKIDEKKCIKCGLCKKTCPNNTEIEKFHGKFYMAINKDEEILKNSSSGGAFSVLASYILSNNGIVIGAYNDSKKRNLYHIVIDNVNDLYKIRGSKYYQSSILNVMSIIKENLKIGKFVLFSGTACQIAALKMYLNRIDLSKLYTVDVLCHGVANRKIINYYLESQEKKFNKKIIDYKFRIKDEKIGWHSGGGTKMKLYFEDGTTYIDEKEVDTFFMAFNKNVILRESCYECNYCGENRVSDFTLGDFWGATEKRVTDEMQKKGVSVMTINTKKAENLYDYIDSHMILTEIDKEEVIPYNLAFEKPNQKPIERDYFFNTLEKNNNFEKTVRYVYRKNYIKNKIKSLLGKKIVEILKRKKKNNG